MVRLVLVLVTALIITDVHGVGAESHAASGKWSKRSIDISMDNDLRSTKIKSPDDSIYVDVQGTRLDVFESEALLGQFGVNLIRELTWSPDSTAFFITQSDGGQLGWWFARAYNINNHSITEVDISSNPLKVFERSKVCPARELQGSNAVAVAWTSNHRILVVVLAPATADCKQGKMGFEVDSKTGTIFREYDRTQLKQKFSHILPPLHY